MQHKRFDLPSVSILSLKRRKDRRDVALSSALWGTFNVAEMHFVDAIDALAYTSVDDLLHEAIKDGFNVFEAVRGYPNRDKIESEDAEKIGFAPVAYAWSLCRYFRDLSEKSEDEFFIHDDVHGVAHKLFRVDKIIIRNLFNQPILSRCKADKAAFACFLMNTRSEGFTPIRSDIFPRIVIGTHRLNLKAGFYSPHGASLILERLKQQVSLGKKTPEAFLSALESTENWHPKGIFSTSEPLFVEYPIEFLGSDIRGIPRLQGPYDKLFSEIKPSL